MADHPGICRRHGRIEIGRRANDAVEVLTEPDLGTEELAINVSLRWRCMSETNSFRFPVLAKQLLKAAVQKPNAELDRLPDRYRSIDLDGKTQHDEFICSCSPMTNDSLCRNM